MTLTLRAYPTSPVSERLQILLNRRLAYAILASVASLLLVQWVSSHTTGKHTFFLPLLLVVVWSARIWGVIPSLASSLTGLIGAWYCIIPPKYSFAFSDRADIVGLVLFACVSGLIIIMLRGAAPETKIAGDSDVEEIKTARLAMQGLLDRYRETVCNCKGGQHDLGCMAHPSSPIILRAQRSIRWMYWVEGSAEEHRLVA